MKIRMSYKDYKAMDGSFATERNSYDADSKTITVIVKVDSQLTEEIETLFKSTEDIIAQAKEIGGVDIDAETAEQMRGELIEWAATHVWHCSVKDVNTILTAVKAGNRID